jgi:ABC-type branched-subunit amino acid transport system permease subunit
VIVVVRRSRLGRLLRGLSDSPVALDAHGANTRLTRLFVFCISAFLAGVGGAMLAGVTQSAGGNAAGPFGYFNSLALVAVLAFCARQPIISPVAAAFVFEVLKIYRPFSSSFSLKYQGVFFGIVAIAVAAVPGMAGLRVSRRAAEREGTSRVSARAELAPAGGVWR